MNDYFKQKNKNGVTFWCHFWQELGPIHFHALPWTVYILCQTISANHCFLPAADLRSTALSRIILRRLCYWQGHGNEESSRSTNGAAWLTSLLIIGTAWLPTVAPPCSSSGCHDNKPVNVECNRADGVKNGHLCGFGCREKDKKGACGRENLEQRVTEHFAPAGRRVVDVPCDYDNRSLWMIK